MKLAVNLFISRMNMAAVSACLYLNQFSDYTRSSVASTYREFPGTFLDLFPSHKKALFPYSSWSFQFIEWLIDEDGIVGVGPWGVDFSAQLQRSLQ